MVSFRTGTIQLQRNTDNKRIYYIMLSQGKLESRFFPILKKKCISFPQVKAKESIERKDSSIEYTCSDRFHPISCFVMVCSNDLGRQEEDLLPRLQVFSCLPTYLGEEIKGGYLFMFCFPLHFDSSVPCRYIAVTFSRARATI